MSLPAAIPAAIVETLLAHLAPLFLIGAGGDAQAARIAAITILAGYKPRNEQELCLAADIISFSFHSLEALSQSGAADVPFARKLRLCSGAVSLNRESHRCRQKLEQMQRQDLAEPQPEAVPTPGRITAEAAIELVEQAQKVAASAARNAQQGRFGGLTYSQALSKRMTAQRMVEKAKRRNAEHNVRSAPVSKPPLVTAG